MPGDLSLVFLLLCELDGLLAIRNFKAVGFVVSGHVVNSIKSRLCRTKILKLILKSYELLIRLFPLLSTRKILSCLVLDNIITLRILWGKLLMYGNPWRIAAKTTRIRKLSIRLRLFYTFRGYPVQSLPTMILVSRQLIWLFICSHWFLEGFFLQLFNYHFMTFLKLKTTQLLKRLSLSSRIHMKLGN